MRSESNENHWRCAPKWGAQITFPRRAGDAQTQLIGKSTCHYDVLMRCALTFRWARWALCAAMLFVASNTVHAIEHDLSGDLGKNHAECHHCSTEQSAAVSTAVADVPSCEELAPAQTLPAACVATTTTSFQARAPPLS